MSPSTRNHDAGRLRRSAPIFAALGDRTRLKLINALAGGSRLSIARLTEGTNLTRQAVTKHLRVLQHAGLVRSVRRGRESRFQLKARPLDDAARALAGLSRQWDVALARLKAMVEE
jgi:DNA-binding transcriptional ArsR family regulator